MELTKNTINICDTVAKGRTQAMTDGDVIVPDTKPDILKLIQVDSDASITDKYIENGRLILCGRVVYKILYVPDRENEKIKSIETSMEFRQAVDVIERYLKLHGRPARIIDVAAAAVCTAFSLPGPQRYAYHLIALLF